MIVDIDTLLFRFPTFNWSRMGNSSKSALWKLV